jgi:hypothetical protein
MPTLREYNPCLANKSRAEVRDMIRRSAYDSSMFEGVKLPKDHPAVFLSKATRRTPARAR